MLKYIIGFIVLILIVLVIMYKDTLLKSTITDVKKAAGDTVAATNDFIKSDTAKEISATAGDLAAGVKAAADESIKAVVDFSKSDTAKDIGANAAIVAADIKKAADEGIKELKAFVESEDTKRVFESAKKDVSNTVLDLVASAKKTLLNIASDNNADRHQDGESCSCGTCIKCRSYHLRRHDEPRPSPKPCKKQGCSCGTLVQRRPRSYKNIEYDSADLQVDDDIQGTYDDFGHTKVNTIGDSPPDIWYFYQGNNEMPF